MFSCRSLEFDKKKVVLVKIVDIGRIFVKSESGRLLLKSGGLNRFLQLLGGGHHF